MRSVQYALLVPIFSAVIYVLVSWYIFDGSNAVTYSYSSTANDSIFPSGKMENLFWFVQVSDLHISKFEHHSRVSDFRELCSKVIPSIDPSLVLVTGDLTDSRRGTFGSEQYEDEWKLYHSVVKETGAADQRPWLDLPGNHDSFNLMDLSGFREYSHSWKQYGAHSYCYRHHTDFGNYSFIAIDAHPVPGPRLPYNFFGVLSEADLLGIKQLSQQCAGANHTVWLSHYPSSFITTNHNHFLQLLSSSIVYLCGHLHNVFGYVDNLYTTHPDGRLELELADWKFIRRYRVLAFDHDLLSFSDVYLKDQPVIVITNPKHHQFVSPSHEPVNRIARSTHIRVLVFSPDPIVSVNISLDDKDIGVMHHVTGPLYVLKWDPVQYKGLHYVTVVATDGGGHVNRITQPFSHDTQPVSLGVVKLFFLQANMPSMLWLMFTLLWLLFVGWLLYSKWRGRHGTVVPAGLMGHCEIIASKNFLFYPTIIFLLNYGIGPWYIGELLSGVYGIVTVHGLFIPGTFIPGSKTYLHGCAMHWSICKHIVSLIL
ncbi:transmembrane protein 62-like isoform X2 [Dysidea avara]|uniref:transmembrane protein 62-like isoform X2 n=1 Tax=Dysidea avara TaxID=196820 RepID=UPI0033334B5B